MGRIGRAVLGLLLLVGVAQADLTVDGTTTVPGYYPVQLKVKNGPKGATYFWRVDGPDGKRLTGQLIRISTTHIVFTGPPGRYAVNIRAVWTKDKATGELDGDEKDIEVTIGDAPPPVPPGPVPPVPPVPPGPAPMPATALRVLMVTKKADEPNLAKTRPGVMMAMYSKKVEDYLNSKCDKEDGFPAWRRLGDNAVMDFAAPVWKDAMKRERKSLPWLIISNGKNGYEGPVPESEDAMIAKLKELGG